MLNEFYTLIAAVFSSSLLTALVNNIFILRTKRNDNDNAVKNGVKLILYNKIKHLGKKYISAGCVSYEDLEDLIKMHECYHTELCGNGYLDSLMTDVKELEIKK